MERNLASRAGKIVQYATLGVVTGAALLFCSSIVLAGLVAIGIVEGLPSLLFGARQPD